MDEERTKRVTEWIGEELAKHPSVERAVLFGSRARGTNRERSDFDIAIWAPDATPREWSDLVEALEEAPTLLWLDILEMGSVSDSMRAEIAREGTQIYGRRTRAA